nr:hypothetical protein [Rhizobium sp. AN83]
MSLRLKLHNTLTREKTEFAPIDADNVRMYVCGPTVYDFAHIGNARPVIVFDVLYRLLRHVYGESHVTYARNITDLDDKINARALRDYPHLPLNDAIHAVTKKTADQFHEDVAALGCLQPTVEPRATDYIAEMIDIIEKLIARGHAYAAGGEVLFDTRSMADYGQTVQTSAGRTAGRRARGGGSPQEDPGDFVLWKLSSHNEPGWESPGAAAVRAGTSNARPWPVATSAKCSTFTAAGSISSSRITRTKSRNPAAPMARR